MKKIFLRFPAIKDVLMTPSVYPAAWLLKKIRYTGIKNLPNCKNALNTVRLSLMQCCE